MNELALGLAYCLFASTAESTFSIDSDRVMRS